MRPFFYLSQKSECQKLPVAGLATVQVTGPAVDGTVGVGLERNGRFSTTTTALNLKLRMRRTLSCRIARASGRHAAGRSLRPIAARRAGREVSRARGFSFVATGLAAARRLIAALLIKLLVSSGKSELRAAIHTRDRLVPCCVRHESFPSIFPALVRGFYRFQL